MPRPHPAPGAAELGALADLLRSLRPASVLAVSWGEEPASEAIWERHGRGVSAAEVLAPPGRPCRAAAATAELVVCRGPLPAPATTGPGIIRELFAATERALLLMGLAEAESSAAGLRDQPGDAEVYPLGRTSLGAMALLLRCPAERHPRDFRSNLLDELIGRHPSPLRLAELRLSAWRSTGFYPIHAPRLWEYPVVADRLVGALPAGSEVLDIGAGVSPLAPYLAEIGFAVDTVDPSPVRRVWSERWQWNEWEFLDYAAAGLARRSWNCALSDLPPECRYDAAYSISVIEHLAAADRRALVAEVSRRLRRGGIALFTVDILRDREELWNRCRGVEVEDPALHGSLTDVLREASSVGLRVSQCELVRGWGDVPIDIALIACEAPPTPL